MTNRQNDTTKHNNKNITNTNRLQKNATKITHKTTYWQTEIFCKIMPTKGYVARGTQRSYFLQRPALTILTNNKPKQNKQNTQKTSPIVERLLRLATD